MKAELRVYFSLAATELDGEDIVSLQERACEELLANAVPFRLYDELCATVEFAIASLTPQEARTALAVEDHPFWTTRYFLASAEVEVDVSALRQGNPRLEGASDLELAYHLAITSGEKFIGDLALLGSIAKPGGFGIGHSAVGIAGYERFTRHAWSQGDMPEIRLVAKSLKWPPLLELPLHTIWTWAHALPGFSDGLVSGRIGRALAAASFLIADERGGSPADLAWALLGLEALFATGSQGLKAQILEKTGVLLGRPTQFRKRFDGVYDYRSRFVHGDLDIPLAYCQDYHTAAIEEFGEETHDCRLLATAVLLSALQTLASRGWQSLEFDYSLRAPTVP